MDYDHVPRTLITPLLSDPGRVDISRSIVEYIILI